MFPIDTAIRILNPQLVEWFRKEGLEGVVLLEEQCHWGQALGLKCPCYSQFSQSGGGVSSQLPLPVA